MTNMVSANVERNTQMLRRAEGKMVCSDILQGYDWSHILSVTGKYFTQKRLTVKIVNILCFGDCHFSGHDSRLFVNFAGSDALITLTWPPGANQVAAKRGKPADIIWTRRRCEFPSFSVSS